MSQPRKTIQVDGVFDIETQDWDTFVVGGFLRRSGAIWRSDCYFDEDALVDELLKFDGVVWAHNGGRYDVMWLIDHIINRKLTAEINLAGQRIVRLKCGKLEIRDSYALIPIALKLAAQMGGGEKESTNLACVCGNNCGGYCSIKRNMSSSDRDKVVSYLRQDLLVTRDMLQGLISFADRHDLDLCGTIGSSAYATAARKLGIRPAKWKTKEYEFIRAAYYGGRTQVFRPATPHGYRIDVNSAYIAALSKLALPIGQRYYEENMNDVSTSYHSGLDGIVSALVEVPYQHIPPLPVRTAARLIYPVGKVVGTWTTLELRYAELCGVKILQFSKGLFWEDRENIFKDFEQYIWDIRAGVGKETAFGQWLKWFANSQTGKFAQHPLVDVYEINPDKNPEERFCPASRFCNNVHYDGAECCPHRCTGRCGIWQEIDRHGKIWTKKEWRIADCAHIHWAAFLTAYQRCYLHDQLVSDGQGGLTAVYCDTDSVFSTEMRKHNLGTGLGDFLFEGEFWDFEAKAPKTYRFYDQAGKMKAKAKGIPEAAKNWINMQSEQGVKIDRGVDSFKQASRREGKYFRKKEMSRHCHGNALWFGDRKLQGDITVPVTISELADAL